MEAVIEDISKQFHFDADARPPIDPAPLDISYLGQLAEYVRTLFGPVAQEVATEAAREYLSVGDRGGCTTWLQVVHALSCPVVQQPLDESELVERTFALAV